MVSSQPNTFGDYQADLLCRPPGRLGGSVADRVGVVEPGLDRQEDDRRKSGSVLGHPGYPHLWLLGSKVNSPSSCRAGRGAELRFSSHFCLVMFCEIYDSVVFDGAHQEDKKDLKAWGDSITLRLKTLRKNVKTIFLHFTRKSI